MTMHTEHLDSLRQQLKDERAATQQLERELCAARREIMWLQEHRDHARAWCTYWRQLYQHGTTDGPDQRAVASDGWSARREPKP